MKTQVKPFVAACSFGLILVNCLFASEIRVPQDCNTIQSAIDQAVDGDTVMVAPGTYTGPGNVNIDFMEKAITVRSELGAELTVIDCNGADVHAVRFADGRDVEYKLIGFTVRNSTSRFGAIFCKGGASPLIEQCVIEDNIKGFYCYDSYTSPLLRNCIIRNNVGDQRPGVSAGFRASPTLEGCVLAGNVCDTYDGGAVYSFEYATMTLKNCLIYGNRAQLRGGGIYAAHDSSTVALVNCTMVDNQAERGGTIYAAVRESSPVVIRNCIIQNKTTSPDFQSLKAALRAGTAYEDDPNDSLYLTFGDVTYSNIQGGWDGAGNIDSDPLFIEADAGNYLLHGASPCVDAGDPTDDYAYEPNGGGGRINMGAYGNTSCAALYQVYPVITAVTPLQGYVGTEFELTLEGVSLGDDPNEMELRLGDFTVTDINSWQDTEIVCRVKFSEPGEKIIVISDSSGLTHSFPEPLVVHPEGLIAIAGDVNGILAGGLMYVITDDVNIPQGEELVIEPGASIYVAPTISGRPYQFVVNGTLYARGEEDRPILFTSLVDMNDENWEGLILNNMAWLEYCEISLARTGIHSKSGNTIINNCQIHDCDTHGIFLDGTAQSKVGLVHQTVIENNGRSGLYCSGSMGSSDGIVSGCTARGNGEWGIHVYTRSGSRTSQTSKPVVEYCDIVGNSHGGIFLEARSRTGSGWVDRRNSSTVSPDIIGCNIYANSGPGISCESRGNITDGSPFDIYRYAYTSPLVDRSLIFANTGSGIEITTGFEESHAFPVVSHCSFYNNGDLGLSVDGKDVIVDLTNSIISTSSDRYFDVKRDASVISSYCLFDGIGALPAGEGNLQGDPQWIDPDNGDFSLQEASPAIDTGVCPTEGECIFNGLNPDMGAVEK